MLRRTYAGRVPGGADLVCYWFEEARAQDRSRTRQRAGLVATNSIRGGANRKVLERIQETGTIFHAWSDQPWINEGAAVQVSLVAFRRAATEEIQLDGKPSRGRSSRTLTGRALNAGGGTDLTQAQTLQESRGGMLSWHDQKRSI